MDAHGMLKLPYGTEICEWINGGKSNYFRRKVTVKNIFSSLTCFLPSLLIIK